MKLFVGLVVLLFVFNGGICGPASGEGSNSGSVEGGKPNGEKFKKKFECMKQTQELKACCPLPKSTEDFKDVPECGHHLEGLEEKEGKKMFHSVVCFTECIFTTKGIMGEDKEIMWEEVKKHSNEVLGEGELFKDVATRSIDFCETKCEEKSLNSKKLLKNKFLF